MKIGNGKRRVFWVEALNRIVCLILVCGLIVFPGTLPVHGEGSCYELSTAGGQRSNCSCSSTAGVVTSCGTGLDVRYYDICYGGRDRGYELCLNSRQTVGSSWDCAATVTWSKMASCSAQAAACAVACASSVTHAGILCAACITSYIATCTGCGYVSCVKVNVKPVQRLKKSASTGVCPKIVNTIN